jgi:hypothetical protein
MPHSDKYEIPEIGNDTEESPERFLDNLFRYNLPSDKPNYEGKHPCEWCCGPTRGMYCSNFCFTKRMTLETFIAKKLNENKN